MTTINSLWFEGDDICVKMNDGTIVKSPVGSYPNLNKGTAEQRSHYEIKGNGRWIHWDELDEDLSAEGLLQFK